MLLYRRRLFLKSTFLTTGVLVMSGCQLFGAVTPYETINTLQKDLFPKANELNINTLAYMTIVFNHSRISDEDKTFIRNGVEWLNEEAVAKYKNSYTKLSYSQRQNTLKSISRKKWGESWLDMMLTHIMEATFSDRVYGVNPKEAGQKWLGFSNGLPKPKEALL